MTVILGNQPQSAMRSSNFGDRNNLKDAGVDNPHQEESLLPSLEDNSPPINNSNNNSFEIVDFKDTSNQRLSSSSESVINHASNDERQRDDEDYLSKEQGNSLVNNPTDQDKLILENNSVEPAKNDPTQTSIQKLNADNSPTKDNRDIFLVTGPGNDQVTSTAGNDALHGGNGR